MSDEEFVYQTMMTCIGNKRKLVDTIAEIAENIKSELGKDKLIIADLFCGSTVVARRLSFLASILYTNDLEYYSFLMAECYLKTPTKKQQAKIKQHFEEINRLIEDNNFTEGIICKLYAPKDTNNIQKGERCFYTRENALIIDTVRKYIEENVEENLFCYIIAPLLNAASINANTSGVFKGFHKDGEIGCFGGKNKNALLRITSPIRLNVPIWNSAKIKVECYNEDINILIDKLPDDLDLIYLDPPYNQHPYGSNYFMLNIIARNEEPQSISKVSGIPTNWNHSDYNYRQKAIVSMKKLIEVGLTKSKYILISYNNEGIITEDDWNELLARKNYKKNEIEYDTFKGSRNLRNRNDKVIEIMYLIWR